MGEGSATLWPSADDSSKQELQNGTIYPTPPLGQDMTQGQFLSGV